MPGTGKDAAARERHEPPATKDLTPLIDSPLNSAKALSSDPEADSAAISRGRFVAGSRVETRCGRAKAIKELKETNSKAEMEPADITSPQRICGCDTDLTELAVIRIQPCIA